MIGEKSSLARTSVAYELIFWLACFRCFDARERESDLPSAFL
jgi:hypothetical protein